MTRIGADSIQSWFFWVIHMRKVLYQSEISQVPNSLCTRGSGNLTRPSDVWNSIFESNRFNSKVGSEPTLPIWVELVLIPILLTLIALHLAQVSWVLFVIKVNPSQFWIESTVLIAIKWDYHPGRRRRAVSVSRSSRDEIAFLLASPG